MKTTKHRLILPIQAKGNVGKSIEATARACWLNQRGIPWQGFDLDGDNRTLSRLFPAQVNLTPLSGQAEDLDELILILRKTTAKPVTLIDPRAHLDAQLMKALAATHFFDIASAQNIGVTLMVFPFDDMDVMTNLDAVCQFCGKQVDYVVVRNPARASRNRMFDNSPLEKELLDCGAVTITVPVLSEFVKLRLAKLEAEQQRGIPFNEAIGNDGLGLDTVGPTVDRLNIAAERAAQLWPQRIWKMALTAGGMVGLSIAILGIGAAYGEMKYHFAKTLADEIRAEKYTLKNNQEVFQKLANADVPVYVARSSDPDGTLIPRGYCLYIPNAQGADFKDGTGRIFFASPRPEAELKRLLEVQQQQ